MKRLFVHRKLFCKSVPLRLLRLLRLSASRPCAHAALFSALLPAPQSFSCDENAAGALLALSLKKKRTEINNGVQISARSCLFPFSRRQNQKRKFPSRQLSKGILTFFYFFIFSSIEFFRVLWNNIPGFWNSGRCGTALWAAALLAALFLSRLQTDTPRCVLGKSATVQFPILKLVQLKSPELVRFCRRAPGLLRPIPPPGNANQ